MIETPRAPAEVWEWKDKIYEERKDMNPSEWANMDREQSRALLKKRGIVKTREAQKTKKVVGA